MELGFLAHLGCEHDSAGREPGVPSHILRESPGREARARGKPLSGCTCAGLAAATVKSAIVVAGVKGGAGGLRHSHPWHRPPLLLPVREPDVPHGSLQTAGQQQALPGLGTRLSAERAAVSSAAAGVRLGTPPITSILHCASHVSTVAGLGGPAGEGTQT